MKVVLLLLAMRLLLGMTLKKQYENCDGDGPNTQPLIEVELRRDIEVDHGQKYILTNGSDAFKILIVNVSGTAYEQGVAIGKLLKEEIKFVEREIYNYGVTFALRFFEGYPKFIRSAIEKFVRVFLRQAINACYILRKPFIPEYFFDEMRGIAEGAEMSYMDIVRLNLIPEMLKAFCTLISAWGPATKNGIVYLHRALDWDERAPVSRYPTIVIYHPDKGVPFANIGFAGLIGSLTAMSSNQIGIGEQMWHTDGDSKMAVAGEPWHFVLRDVAQFATSLGHAQRILENAHRTCLIHMMIASAKDNAGRGVFYSYNRLVFYDDKNFTEEIPVPGTVYFPFHSDACVQDVIKDFANKSITGETFYRYINALDETGDTLSCVMDLTNEDIYFAFAGYEGSIPAYLRPHIKLSMKQFWGNRQ